MLVKKFEAPSMKEALNLVKIHLGPEAVILSAKDNANSFGLVGKTSVEVTAAISETQLKKKQFAESRLREEDKEKLKDQTAKMQKQFIQKSVSRFTQAAPEVEVDRKRMRYIDIDDESQREPTTYSRAAQPQQSQLQQQPNYSPQTMVSQNYAPQKPVVPKPKANPEEVLSLKAEVLQLRSLLDSFKKVPQTGMGNINMTLHPGASHGLPYEMSALFSRLMEAGISEKLAVGYCKQAIKELSSEQVKKKSLTEAWAAKRILTDVVTTRDPYAPGVHVFVGANGHGKTSSLVKMASQLVIKDRKPIAILTTDTNRVGAAEQLKIFAQILNVPFGVIRSKNDWDGIMQALQGVSHVFVDMPGLSLRSIAEIDQIKSLLPPESIKTHTHLVQSVNQKDEDAFEIARRYRWLKIEDVIFTKLDETVNHGLVVNYQSEFGLPLHSFGIGPLIPEDYEVATKERVVDLVFKISKIKNN